MSIIIKGLDMPKSCGECNIICELEDVEYYEVFDSKSPHCPLVEIPTPHGRLIDEKEAMKEWCKGCSFKVEDWCEYSPNCEDFDILKLAPTILEAEDS